MDNSSKLKITKDVMSDPWADDRVRCEDCAHYGPVSKWHPSRDEDGAHKRITLDGCLLDRAHTVGNRLRRCERYANAPRKP